MGDSDEECLKYGTPLDPYDEDEVPKKKSAFQDITEQYALDAQGRRRFHGAFTGGFSAGHYNTVALPEGWQPQTFKSSRSDRMQLNQKPEDFMDDEDRSEHGIAPREVHTTKDFGGRKRTKQKSFFEGPIPGEPVLQKLLEPVHETVAIKILKSMGWRPGKGVGEKVTKKEKKKTYTCHIPQEFRVQADQDKTYSEDDSEEEDDEDEYSAILFEPDDYELFVVKPKVDAFGLGYEGLSRHLVLGPYQKNKKDKDEWQGSHLVMSDKGRNVSIRGQAFGVGALEEDDDDIYAREDLTGYDFALDNVPKKKDEKKSNPNAAKKSFKTILEGFELSKVEYKPAKSYPPPTLPLNYTPCYLKVKKSRFSDADDAPTNTQIIRDRGLGRHELTAKDRGNILGEKSETSSNIVKTPDKQGNANKSLEDKLLAVTNRNINFVNNSSETPESEKPQTKPEIALPKKAGDFKPFATNPQKQTRYENFVMQKEANKNNSTEVKEQNQNDKISKWEYEREMYEFERAYKLYKPLSGTMGEKFVTAEYEENSPMEVTKSSACYASAEKIEAARTGMFGKLTREVKDWVPDSILCKRFNVAEPKTLGYAPPNADKKTKKYSIFEYLEAPVHSKSSYLKEQCSIKIPESKPVDKINTTDSNVKKPDETIKNDSKKDDKFITLSKEMPGKRLTVAELFLQEKQRERELANSNEEAETGDREEKNEEVNETIENFNKIDLYKAVFLSSSEESEDEDDKSKTEETTETAPKNILRNDSPPKGIFANLNFDKMNMWRNNRINDDKNIVENKMQDQDKSKSKVTTSSAIVENKNDDIDEGIYGPKLPSKPPMTANVLSDTVSLEIDSSSDSSDWIETDKVREKKPKKKKSKKSSKKKKNKSNKHHKHKSKHK